MRSIRALWRLARATLHALVGFLIIMLRFPRMSPDAQGLRVQVWATRMLRILGIGLEVSGRPPAKGPVLLVANHISWLDILVMHAARHCRFVAKSDVQHWPLIGRLSTGSGTLYIDRSSRRAAARMTETMAASLRNGDVLAVFPEGTTGDGRSMLPFYSNLLQSAITAAEPIQPVGIRFVDEKSGSTSFAPSYVNDETLIGSIWRTLVAEPIIAKVNFGEARNAAGCERRALALELHAEVDRLRGL